MGETDTPVEICEKCGEGYVIGDWPFCPHGTGSNGVVGDDIKGGVFYAQNGICNPDGSPRAFTKHSDMRKFAKELGLTSHVEHQGTKGSDKSPHTQRFI